MKTLNFEKVELLFRELADFYRSRLLATGKRIVPGVTEDDLLQPNDFPALENHPEFRYEEGVLAGVKTAEMALFALMKENE